MTANKPSVKFSYFGEMRLFFAFLSCEPARRFFVRADLLHFCLLPKRMDSEREKKSEKGKERGDLLPPNLSRSLWDLEEQERGAWLQKEEGEKGKEKRSSG